MKKFFIWALAPLSVLLIAYMTYFHNYNYPSNLFWDENYHIASAEKYLEWVYFMEPHPPLWKLIIALWEKIINPNSHINKSEFTKTDYIKKVPSGFSFSWFRFFPAIFWMLSAVLIYFIFYLLSGKQYISLLFSSLYLFENWMITQSRSAMLDSIQIFFTLLPILYFIYIVQKKNIINFCNYLILWVLIWLWVSVKMNSAILLLLPVFMVFYEIIFHKNTPFNLKNLMNYSLKTAIFIIWFSLTFLWVRYIHISNWKKIVDNKYYQASTIYRQALNEWKTSNLLYFPSLLRDNLNFVSHYQKWVPALDVCKKWENWSYPLRWLVWAKTINYRREAEDKFEKIRYIYFMWNPIIWWSVLFVILISFSLIISTIFFWLKIKNKKLFFYISMLFCMYVCYMIAVLQITRVMYIYHYLIALWFGIILIFLMYLYLFDEHIDSTQEYVWWKIHVKKHVIHRTILSIYLISIFWTYIFFSPFSYYSPLTKQQFQQRMRFEFRELKPVN